MNKFEYKPIFDKVNEEYKNNSKNDIDSSIDLSKITMIVETELEKDADLLRSHVTDIRMWEKL